VRHSEEDEHSLIAAYCRILTGNNNNTVYSTASILNDVDRRLDSLEQEAVEQMIEQLREENSRLEAEHRELLAGQARIEPSPTSEEKTLRQQRARLEARMAILEDHNRQLEAQLDRLRQLVTSGEPPVDTELGSVVVVAAQLHGRDGAGEEVGGDRPDPPRATVQNSSCLTVPGERTEMGSGRSSHRDSGTSGDTARHSATSGSLNLSLHATEIQDD